jgi:hypothetical protein
MECPKAGRSANKELDMGCGRQRAWGNTKKPQHGWPEGKKWTLKFQNMKTAVLTTSGLTVRCIHPQFYELWKMYQYAFLNHLYLLTVQVRPMTM